MSPHVHTAHPDALPPGTEVGPWRVEAWAGQGVHGAVYRAVRVGQEQAGPVALKLALTPDDPRMARERALLSLVDHPSIPRLLDSGEWRHPHGTRHPYLIMQWVDGAPLYLWAEFHSTRGRPVLRMLAQLARALQTLHAQGAVHRDVKGGNILVRHTDGRAVLTDFGSGFQAGAATLTPPGVFPGTPVYRPPEAMLHELRSVRGARTGYSAGPADDLYALGVTACRLVTGEYPAPGEPTRDEAGNWRLETVVPPAALFRDRHVAPPLRALILRMLSVRPEERGTAAELADLLEEAEAHLQEVATSAHSRGVAGPAMARADARPWRRWLPAVAAGLALISGMWWAGEWWPVEQLILAREEVAGEDKADAGTSGLGEAVATAFEEDAPESSMPDTLAEDSLPRPLPGQTRPDSKGRCPRKRQVALNGGCWLEVPLEGGECAEVNGQMFKGQCYVPFIAPGRHPASSPSDPP
ncbi:serine/threonine-protein kinase [Hyalangium gracile]|uniref:serine/threonine-protein kinase n=1 Tax=Hyalangium gracile TaxID=394092 RepID=UPI001CCE6B15|nr:serine/threonine-protein kinase [Hyalangium gracile]